MYDDYSYERRDEDYYDRPARSRRERYREPEREEDYPSDDYYSPRPGREPPETPRGRERPPKPPYKPPKMKPPRGPKQIPTMISFCVVIGILLMFIGILIITFATPTTPPPEIPEGPDSQYYDEYNEWAREYANSNRTSAFYKNVGIAMESVGALLTGLPLVAGGLVLADLDMRLRLVMIIAGMTVLVVIFAIPLVLNRVNPLI
jgi:hypothetical protein